MLSLILAVPASAFGAFKIHRIYYDSPGSDTGSNASLNEEWVQIRNTGGSSVFLRGWTLRDTAGHVYRFTGGRIGGGKSIFVHTGPGRDTFKRKYWGQGWHVWNNDGDRATLRRRNGSRADSCSYPGGSPGYIHC